MRQQAVQADGRQQQRDQTKQAGEARDQPLLEKMPLDGFRLRPYVHQRYAGQEVSEGKRYFNGSKGIPFLVE